MVIGHKDILVRCLYPTKMCILARYLRLLFHSIVGKTDLLQDYDTLVSSHSSRVRCPPEVNPSWRW